MRLRRLRYVVRHRVCDATRRPVAQVTGGRHSAYRGWLMVCMLMTLVAGCASVRPCGELELGPVASCDTPSRGVDRFRAAGPIVEHQMIDRDQRFTAVRPFYSVTTDKPRNRQVQDFLWPLGSVKRLERETMWRVVLAYGHDLNNEQSGAHYHGMVFPLIFWGRGRDETPYFSIFPLGGTLRDFLGADRIVYALFPLYAQRETGDLRSLDLLWPIFHRATSDDVSRFRIFPLYGRSVDAGEYIKQFVLWPFWTHARYLYPGHTGSSYILFPLFGRTQTEEQTGWMVLPPLFRWAKSEKRTMLNAPWPFVQYASGDYNKLYLWPLWGRRERDGARASFVAWPFVHMSHIERAHETLDHLLVLPFIYHERVMAKGKDLNTSPDVTKRYFKLWPLVSYQREAQTSRVRLLELWPLKQSGPVERNLAPLWSLYTRTETPQRLEHELLWGLFRYRRQGETDKLISLFPLYTKRKCLDKTGAYEWSLLLGLLGHKQQADASVWRVLWFLEFGKDRSITPNGTRGVNSPGSGVDSAGRSMGG